MFYIYNGAVVRIKPETLYLPCLLTTKLVFPTATAKMSTKYNLKYLENLLETNMNYVHNFN